MKIHTFRIIIIFSSGKAKGQKSAKTYAAQIFF